MKRMITLLAVLGMVLALAPAAQAAPVVPMDGYPGAYRIIFCTIGGYDAVSTDIAVYNGRVEAVAAATAGQTYDVSDITGWKMIGSTVGMNARVNTGTTLTNGLAASGDVPIYNMLGVRVADDNAKLWNTTFGAYDDSNSGPGFYTFPTPDDHLAFILHVNGNNPGYGNRTWTGTYAGGASNTGNELGAATVAQADNRQVDAGWVAEGPGGNPSTQTGTYLHYGLSPVLRIPPPAGTVFITK